MIKKVINYIKDSLKRNFKISEYFEHVQRLLMGAVTFLAFMLGGWELGCCMLLVSLIDPRWFDE
jgi:hypothetical protein